MSTCCDCWLKNWRWSIEMSNISRYFDHLRWQCQKYNGEMPNKKISDWWRHKQRGWCHCPNSKLLWLLVWWWWWYYFYFSHLTYRKCEFLIPRLMIMPILNHPSYVVNLHLWDKIKEVNLWDTYWFLLRIEHTNQFIPRPIQFSIHSSNLTFLS